MTDKHVPWAAPQAERAEPPGQPSFHELHGSGAPFRPSPVAPLKAPGTLIPLAAQYGLSPRFQHGARAVPVAPPPAARPPPAAPLARGGTLPPGALSQQDVLSASGVHPPSALPFVPAPQAERAMPFVPGPITDRMGAAAVQPPPPAPITDRMGAAAVQPPPPVPPAMVSPSEAGVFGAMRPSQPTLPPASSPHLVAPPVSQQTPVMHPSAGPPSSRGMPQSAPGPMASPTPTMEPPSTRSPVQAAVPSTRSPVQGTVPMAHSPVQAALPFSNPAALPESPWASTSARLEMHAPAPALPTAREPQVAMPPVAPAAAPAGSSSRMPVLVLGVILAVALLALVGISVWQSLRGREPISIDYTEPSTGASTEPPPPASETAASPAPAAPRAPERPRPKKDDIYDEVDMEKRR